MARPEIITFDCYGTLIDWNAGIVGALTGEALRQGREVAPETVLTAYHAAEPRVQQSGYISYRQVLTLLEGELATELDLHPPDSPGYLADSLPGWTPFPDTNGALQALVDEGFRLGILSNIDDDLLAATRRHFEVEFELLVTAQQVRRYKPATVHFERALEHVGGEPGKLLHVAQSYFHDVRPACGLGIEVVWVNRLRESIPPDGPRPAAVVADLDEAVSWVRGAGEAG